MSTPGPWHVGVFKDRDGISGPAVFETATSLRIADDLSPDDALLIAAAPDLFAALTEIIDRLAPAAESGCFAGDSIGAAMVRARFILAKARGSK